MKLQNIMLIGILFMVLSCNADNVPYSPQIVLEGWVEAGKPPVVILHETIMPGESFSSIEDLMSAKIINWGKVTISDGENDVILTGMRDSDLIPPYKYSTSRMIPESGKTYSVKVEYSDKELLASTSLPEVVPIDSVGVNYSENRDFAALTVYWTDPFETTDWYCLFYRPDGGRQWVCASMSAVSDESAEDNGKMSMCLIPRKNLTYGNLGGEGMLSSYLSTGYSFDIRLAHIDHQSYLIWKSISEIGGTESILSVCQNNILSNVEGGLGYFSGFGASDVRIDFDVQR